MTKLLVGIAMVLALVATSAMAQTPQERRDALYRQLRAEEYIQLNRWQTLSGKIAGAKTYKEVVEAEDRLHKMGPHTRLLGLIDAIIEAEQEVIRAEQAAGPAAPYMRGLWFLEQGDFEQAIVQLTAAIEADPSDVFAYTKRAMAHEKKGDRKSALADYRKALTVANDKDLSKEINSAIRRLSNR